MLQKRKQHSSKRLGRYLLNVREMKSCDIEMMDLPGDGTGPLPVHWGSQAARLTLVAAVLIAAELC